MSRRRILCASMVLALLPSDCAPVERSDFHAVLLLAGPENDEGWNQSAYEGLQRIKADLSARTRKITARTRAEIERALGESVDRGASLVIGHGFEFNEPAAAIAARFPDVQFVTTGGTRTAPNLAVVQMRLEEAAEQLGAIAAWMTRTGRLSVISGEAFEPVKRVAAGFRRGALAVRADLKIHEEYLGSWEDAALAKEKALAHAALGCDVYFQNADAAGAGIFEACRARGLVAFGCNRDQTPKAPDVILASAVADIPDTLLALAREAADQRFRGGLRSFGLAEGKVRIALNPALEKQMPAEARGAAEAVRRAILGRSGSPP